MLITDNFYILVADNWIILDDKYKFLNDFFSVPDYKHKMQPNTMNKSIISLLGW